MHPILWTIEMSPPTARIAGIIAAIALSIFIVYDGWREHGRAKLASTITQAVIFFAISMSAAIFLLVPERLPELIKLDIRSWGIAAIVGMCACFLVQRRLGRDIGLDSKKIFSLWVWGGVGAIAGARALQVAVNWSDYVDRPLTALAFWDGGMVYVGGVTVALIVGIFYARRHQLGLRAFDILALGVALTQGIGRLGCFGAGCCYGRETALPWGVSFPVGSIAHYAQVTSGALPLTAQATPPLHPTQLYEALACFAIGAILLVWYLKKNPKPGLVVCGYFVLYSSVRFVLEMFRADPDRQFLFRMPIEAPILLSTSQVAGIVLTIVALLVARRFAAASASASASVAVVEPNELRSLTLAANDDK